MDGQTIADWQRFFPFIAGPSAGLAGLVFVSLSLHLKAIRAHPPYRYRARSSLASLMMVFVVSLLVLLPKQTSEWLGLEELVVIGAEGAFLIWTFLLTRQAVANVPGGLTHLRPYQIRTTLAVALALFGMVGAALVWAGLEAGFYLLTAFCVTTIVWVIINTWALVTGITEEGSN